MPRKWTEIITDFPALRPDHAYRVRIVEVDRTNTGMRLDLEHVDEEQAGRRHALKLDRPFRPSSLLAQLSRAAGLDASPRRRVAPHDMVGRIVKVYFECTADDAALDIVRIEPDVRAASESASVAPAGESAEAARTRASA